MIVMGTTDEGGGGTGRRGGPWRGREGAKAGGKLIKSKGGNSAAQNEYGESKYEAQSLHCRNSSLVCFSR